MFKMDDLEIRKIALQAAKQSGVTNPSTLALVQFARIVEEVVLQHVAKSTTVVAH